MADNLSALSKAAPDLEGRRGVAALDLEKMLVELRGERDLIERVIAAIENLSDRGKRGRGRPEGSVTKMKQDVTMKLASER